MAKKDGAQLRKTWSAEATRVLAGRTIVKAQYIPDPGWGTALELTLDNGTKVYPSSDDEGNDAGALQCAEPENQNTILPRLR